MPAPSVVDQWGSAGTGGSRTLDSVALRLPNVVNGDLMLAFFCVPSGVTITLPSGWTSLITSTSGNTMNAAYRIASSEGSNSYTWSSSSGTAQVELAIQAYRNGKIQLSGSDLGENTFTDTHPKTPNGLTALADNSVISCCYEGSSSATVTAPSGATIYSPSNNSGFANYCVYTETQAARGSVTARQFTLSTSQLWNTLAVVIAPLGGGSQMML